MDSRSGCQRRGFPSARIKVFSASGHWPFVDYPRRSRKLIVRFLRSAVQKDLKRAAQASASSFSPYSAGSPAAATSRAASVAS
jgi:hypothetical protein